MQAHLLLFLRSVPVFEKMMITRCRLCGAPRSSRVCQQVAQLRCSPPAKGGTSRLGQRKMQ